MPVFQILVNFYVYHIACRIQQLTALWAQIHQVQLLAKTRIPNSSKNKG